MYTQPYLLTAADLVPGMRLRMRDPSGPDKRWRDDEYRFTLNEVLQQWHERVRLPALYNLPNGFGIGVFEYDIPNYIRPPLTVELRREYFSLLFERQDGDTSSHTWKAVGGWRLEPNGSGGQKLRMHNYPFDVEGRIIYYVTNGPVPTDDPQLSADIDEDDTTLTVNDDPNVADVGWVRVDSEWLQYSGVQRASGSLTLQNLVRGLYGTTAASHLAGATVYWGVAVDSQALWGQLRDMWELELHRLYLTDASEGERRRHQEQASWLAQRITDFWKYHYISQPDPQFVLGSRTIGL